VPDNSKSVFELYAHEYDLITNAAARRKPHGREIAGLIRRFQPGTALDAGCANGLSAALLAEAGVETVGLDRSRQMITEAKKKWGDSGLPVSFRTGDFEKLPQSLFNKFDMVVCLANSISGISTVAGLNRAMRGFNSVLKPGGQMVLQMLNFSALPESTLQAIKGTENGGIVYERFRERTGRNLNIYVSRLDLNAKPTKLEVFKHTHPNFTPQKMLAAYQKAGFKSVRRYGNLLLEKRFSAKCVDLVIVGRKPTR
jgi:2-polyprenyl-3-methyl-5-hydroxy-6-metoxy-1,4-benzoquinol methylase